MWRDIVGVFVTNILILIFFRVLSTWVVKLGRLGYGGMILIILPISIPLAVPSWSRLPVWIILLHTLVGLLLLFYDVKKRLLDK